MDFLSHTRRHCPELAQYFEEACERELSFEGPYPFQHSSHNHMHLCALEYWADRHKWIDVGYRTTFAEAILARWTARLKGFAPHQRAGYRLYVYEDIAPTLSVVAETPFGCPYGGLLVHVPDVASVMALYANTSWSDRFTAQHNYLPPARILAEIERHNGSISSPTAEALGLNVGELRLLIEQENIAVEVNAIRKRWKRRPARFRDEMQRLSRTRIFERILPPGSS